MSYTNINSAKKAFSKLLELHLNSHTFSISYVLDNLGDKTLLTSINESSDPNKSDKSDDGSDTEKKEAKPVKEEEKASRTLNQGWSPLQELASGPQAGYPVFSDLNTTMPLPQERSIIPQTSLPQYYSHSNAGNYINHDFSACTMDNEPVNER